MAEQCITSAFKSKEKPKGKIISNPRMRTNFMPFTKHTVLVIAGTTAVGKTDLSLELAKLLDIEVVSVDSAQVAILLDSISSLSDG